MIKVEYGLPKIELNKRYLKLFETDLSAMVNEWRRIRGTIGGRYSVRSIPADIRDILTADYNKLVNIYVTYLNMHRLPKNIKDEIINLFDYKKYQPQIAGFFMEPENKFQIHVCHYCGTAYINAYGIMNDYKDKLDFIQKATTLELKKFIPGNLSDRTIKMIIDNRDMFTCLDDFDNLSCWRSDKKSDSIKLLSDNHFDLDHELDKGSCPLVALSLYNFVPCCPVCNEKLKRTVTLGDKTNKNELIKLSPTSDSYNFDGNVTFFVIPRIASTFGFLKNQNKYKIDITCQDAAFKKTIDLFRLKQRYNHHKVFALRLLDLKERYSKGSIKMISNLLQKKQQHPNRYTEQQIYEDIFGEEYSKVGHRCFDKLRRDILK